jgi:peptidoglycan/xylan/chitin deacetylase (PgdA/CDA1 family)
MNRGSPEAPESPKKHARGNINVFLLIALASCATMGLVIYSQYLLIPANNYKSDAFIPSATISYNPQQRTRSDFQNPTQILLHESVPSPTSRLRLRFPNTPVPTIKPLTFENPDLTFVPFITDTPFMIETPTQMSNGAGSISVPILLYHHISDKLNPTRYVISINVFKKQMQILKDLEYTTITASQLAELIRGGGYIPLRPIVITFDDGFADIYHNAYPILNEFGFVGVVYIISGMVNMGGHLNLEQIQELAINGWEIGSHSVNHYDLTKLDGFSLVEELQQSKIALEEMVGSSIVTFAYPYGEANDEVRQKTEQVGYRAGMRLGINTTHMLSMLYNLNRIEIENRYSIEQFTSFLPWTNPP